MTEQPVIPDGTPSNRPATDDSQLVSPSSDLDLRGRHPRPQLIRPNRWWSLDGQWSFTFDDGDVGLAEHWYAPHRAAGFAQTIEVPFPPESAASGIGDNDDHAALWYRRSFQVPLGLGSDRLLLHFGAVDYECDVWLNGQHAARHEGGQTPFSVDVTDLVNSSGSANGEHVLVVRATDDRTDVEQPRGKQDWQPEQHVIWYRRTSGIWRTVWLEQVPALRVQSVQWLPDVPEARVRARIRLTGNAPTATKIRISIADGDNELGQVEYALVGKMLEADIPIPALRNGQAYESLLWTPGSPHLLEVRVQLLVAGSVVDDIESYLGLRSVAVSGGELLLNGRPFRMRAVLEQGYWPESHLTPPSLAALKAEVELTKSLGFNAVRIHQKVEDPRFLYWCDVLGLAVWGETAAAYQFSDVAISQLTREWIDIVRRDISHPSIIVWVPFNESWGVPHIATDAAQQAFTRGLADLTRALDPTRPVISNDGWEHTASDLLTVHDYADTGAVLTERYADDGAVSRTVAGFSPAHGRRTWVGPQDAPAPTCFSRPMANGAVAGSMAGSLPPSDCWPEKLPVLLTEFGGISYDPAVAEGSWGYSTASSAADLAARLTDLLAAVHASSALKGFCYTQLTDTGLETNGLCDENRVPKLPIATIREIIAG